MEPNALYFDRLATVDHEHLTKPAYELLAERLTKFGNNVNEPHQLALMALLGTFTEMAQGKRQGRYAFGIPTGQGKTEAVIAWLTTLHRTGNAYVSVAIAASKVEALCEIKRKLIELGVPVEKIGLIHAKLYDSSKIEAVRAGGTDAERYATEPSEGEDRQILLITHQRVRGSNLSTFNRRNGRARDLLIYDESLLVSDSIGFAINRLDAIHAAMEKMKANSAKHQPLIAYLGASVCTLKKALSRQKEGGADAIITLPEIPAGALPTFLQQLSENPFYDPAKRLLEIADQQLRVTSNGQGGIAWYQISVPAEIKNIAILDASQPIRRLVHLDPSIQDAEKVLPQMLRVGVPLSKLKRFDAVTVHQMRTGGGRSTVGNSLREAFAEDRKVVREVVEVVKTIPENEAVLIFTYKQRHKEDIDFKGTFLADFEKAGIDTSATVNTPFGPRPRLSVITWGMETSLNDYDHCSWVFMPGVLQLDQYDLAASFLGQSDDIEADISTKTMTDLLRSEVCHRLYQGGSRGTMRKVDCGKARPMNLYFMHLDQGVREEMTKVMPGAVWAEWKSMFGIQATSVIADLADQIRKTLSELPSEVDKVSTSKLKKTMQVNAPKDTWTQALSRHLEGGSEWLLRERSLIRASSFFEN